MKVRLLSTAKVLKEIKSKASMRPVGSNVKSIQSIHPLLMGIAFEIGQLSRYVAGQSLQYDDFDE